MACITVGVEEMCMLKLGLYRPEGGGQRGKGKGQGWGRARDRDREGKERWVEE